MVTTRAKDVYTAGQFHTLAYGRLYKGSAARGVIYCHGGAGTDITFITPDASDTETGNRDLIDHLTARGYPCIGFTATFTWGNDTAMSRMDDLYTYVTGTLGFPTEVDLLCGSMGFTTGCAWTKRNPTKVNSIVGMVPLTHLDNLHDENRGGFAASIETAYTDLAGYNATVATRDPSQYTSSLTSIPMKLWYSSDDVFVLPGEVTAFAAAVGCEAVSMGPVGHSIHSLDPDAVLQFFNAQA